MDTTDISESIGKSIGYSLICAVVYYPLGLLLALVDLDANILDFVLKTNFFVIWSISFIAIMTYYLIKQFQDGQERKVRLKKQDEINKKNQETRKIKLEKQKIFEKIQEGKGLILYEDKWLNKQQLAIAKKRRAFFDKHEANDNYKGFIMTCSNCKYTWKVRKDFGLPAKCGKCNSEYIHVNEDKTYETYFTKK